MSDAPVRALPPSPAGEQDSAAQWLDTVLHQAVRDRASDVHFEPFDGEYRVRARVDGTLRDIARPPAARAAGITSRLKVLAGVNIAERRVPQDGRIRLEVDGRSVDLRLSTLPTQFGESVVLRVLDSSANRLELGELGLPPAAQSGLRAMLQRPNGILVVTGPTGCGKTTTLYSCLRELNRPNAKVLTVEDPVEYELEGVMQVAVNPVAGLTFPRALRTFLRQDPDVVVVGEIRDAETARIAIQASLTGHLVLATLHTNDAVSAVTRLIDMGIEPFLLASALEVVIAQRLVRRACPNCREPFRPTEDTLRELGAEAGRAEASHVRAPGCVQCRHQGYRGRVGVFEYLPVTEAFRTQIMEGASLVALRQQVAAEGVVTLRTHAVQLAARGETTIAEVLRHT